ncbi:hypothetical protein [Actibacterium mucosum]|nr:hypothetical protein [Actibacterium mucosum]
MQNTLISLMDIDPRHASRLSGLADLMTVLGGRLAQVVTRHSVRARA